VGAAATAAGAMFMVPALVAACRARIGVGFSGGVAGSVTGLDPGGDLAVAVGLDGGEDHLVGVR
jgi:hypothetical protein